MNTPVHIFDELNLPNQGSIGVFISGGADSALLLYLISKVVKDRNLPVQVHPITGERLGRPFNLRHAQRVKECVQSLLNLELGLHFCYVIPSHRNGFTFEQESQVNGHYGFEFSRRYNLSHLYFAHSQPLSGDQKDDFFQVPGVESAKILQPFKNINKTQIAKFYSDFGLISSLFPKTRSCESDLIESHYFQKVCSEIEQRPTPCMGCTERVAAFQQFL